MVRQNTKCGCMYSKVSDVCYPASLLTKIIKSRCPRFLVYFDLGGRGVLAHLEIFYLAFYVYKFNRLAGHLP